MSPRAAGSSVNTVANGFSRSNGARRSPSAIGLSPTLLSALRLLSVGLANLPLFQAAPAHTASISLLADDEGKSASNPKLWVYLTTAVALVLLGGAFAGLTIALMGQDEIYLQVIATSGEGSEKRHAKRVLRLLKKGKHWVLVTLLLSNVITNETLPIVLDRSLGGGWPAVLSSTVLIVIFGEIAPQSVCVRYGLSIGAWMSPFVLVLMWIMAPVAWPTAKLLDWLLGEDHGTTYKKAGLKTLVDLHKTLGTSPDERLNQDEVTIISAVLDLKDKPVGSIMTPMNDVFTLSADAVLDEQMMDVILSAGYSRIPIHAPDNDRNFVGMLLVKMLITYDPEDGLRVRDFALATLPETRPETSCLDIVNFFQEGKSHMVLVSDYPGESFGALGVVTLEDVIEELIGEEIIDESDVFIDVHKAIRRLAPAPKSRVPKGEVVADPDHASLSKGGDHRDAESEPNDGKPKDEGSRKPSLSELGRSPKTTTFLMRRRSSNGATPDVHPVALRSNTPEMREHFKHFGPSNVASRPKQTRYHNVKIKPGVSTIPETQAKTSFDPAQTPFRSTPPPSAPQGGVGEGLIPSAGHSASDAVQAVQTGYGTVSSGFAHNRDGLQRSKSKEETSANDDRHGNENTPLLLPKHAKTFPAVVSDQSVVDRPRSQGSGHSSSSQSPERGNSSRKARKSRGARSGSIMEHMLEAGGVKKLVLEANSSSENENDEQGSNRDADQNQNDRRGSADSGNSGESGDEGGSTGGGTGMVSAFVRTLNARVGTGRKKAKTQKKKEANGGKQSPSPSRRETEPLLHEEA